MCCYICCSARRPLISRPHSTACAGRHPIHSTPSLEIAISQPWKLLAGTTSAGDAMSTTGTGNITGTSRKPRIDLLTGRTKTSN